MKTEKCCFGHMVVSMAKSEHPGRGKQVLRLTVGWVEGMMDGRIDGWLDGFMDVNGWMGGWVCGGMDGWKGVQMDTGVDIMHPTTHTYYTCTVEFV